MARDLIVLVADKNIHYGLRGLFARPRALGIRQIDAEILVHPRRDPACAREAHAFLRPFARLFDHALVVYDHEGSGFEHRPSAEVAAQVRTNLAGDWRDRGDVVVLDPELEIWVFSDSPHVANCLGWRRQRRLRHWLQERGMWPDGTRKPPAPRAALERVLQELRRPRSSSLYECLGRRVGTRDCVDPAFVRLRTVLSGWFPA